MMAETSLVHIIKDGCVLMLHRVRKKHDINHDKWIGVGGKFEWGETPEACMRRETFEETGLIIDQYRYCGIVTFVSMEDDIAPDPADAEKGAATGDTAEASAEKAAEKGMAAGDAAKNAAKNAAVETGDMEYMHLFTVTGFHDMEGTYVRDGKSAAGAPPIRLKDCAEGELEWLPKGRLTQIPHWTGDRLFLSMILEREFPFFSMKLVYRAGELVQASLQEHNCLVTERLLLRPWLPEDASDLYKCAKNPNIGPRAGWPPHTDVADSRRVIREVLSRPEMYAIVLRDTSQPIGSVGLQNFRITGPDGELISYFDERKSEDPLCCTRQGHIYNDPTSEAAAHHNHMTYGREGSSAEYNGDSEQAGERFVGPDDPDSFLPAGLQIEAELGYWLAEPYWHRGIMTEAAQAVLEHGRKHLSLARVWADYYEGNEASRQVMERLGFHFHHMDRHRVVELLGEERTSCVNVLEWGQRS